MHVHALTLDLYLPGCRSLKEKRGRLKPVLAGLHKQFNVSAAETDQHDLHQSAVIVCVVVSNSNRHGDQVLAGIPRWVEGRWPDLQIVDHHMEVR